ncbi:MAG: hypothetical protein KAQ87_05035 [Candidatus Pacebacteria bacterium]|nr:hypothetical protein [Candidatus Paceibacterota bacterium]
MKKQTLFNLASMPKMVLVVTLVIMLGTLFGAISYLVKIPKVDLPIVNPVIETQCKIDSDCNLVFTGSYISCNSPEEDYKCLNISKDDADAINQNKKRIGFCLTPDKYTTCKCENGKCEKVKEETIEEMSITTDKMEYERGETVNITVKNNLDNQIKHFKGIGCGLQGFSNKHKEWVNASSRSCKWEGEDKLKSNSEYSFNWITSRTGLEKYRIAFHYQEQELIETKEIGKIICEGEDIPEELEKLLLSGDWIKSNNKGCATCDACGCSCVAKNVWIVGGATIDINYVSCGGNGYTIKYKGEEYNCVPENYKPLYEQASIYPKVPEGWETIYSNEFTIKEKSAFDSRCSEKVTFDSPCHMSKIINGYEFDLTLNKCKEVSVYGGCSFETPFKTLEECQEVCEKSNISKVGSYLAFLMTEKGLQEQYRVDIEFSNELSDEKLMEIENNYELTFSRLPNGNIAHTAQFCGAKINGYAIKQLSKRLDVIRIESLEKPVSN